MMIVLRTIAAILAGMLAVLVLVILVELFSAVVHPFPEGFGNTEEEMCAHVERYPAWVLAAVVPMWAGAALVGTWIAQRIGNLFAAATVGVLVFAALVLNLSMLPYPIWFKAGCLVALPAAMVAGAWWGRPKRPDQTMTTEQAE